MTEANLVMVVVTQLGVRGQKKHVVDGRYKDTEAGKAAHLVPNALVSPLEGSHCC